MFVDNHMNGGPGNQVGWLGSWSLSRCVITEMINYYPKAKLAAANRGENFNISRTGNP